MDDVTDDVTERKAGKALAHLSGAATAVIPATESEQ